MTLCLALTVLAGLLIYRMVRRRRERRHTAPHPMAQAFSPREMRELDARLKRIARSELRRLEREVKRYLTGTVGYVVTIYRSPDGVTLQLSDGRRLGLAGVSLRALQLLVLRAAEDRLQPTHVHRDASSHRLRLRGQAGADIDIHARTVALAP
jgi:hypothetical protein